MAEREPIPLATLIEVHQGIADRRDGDLHEFYRDTAAQLRKTAALDGWLFRVDGDEARIAAPGANPGVMVVWQQSRSLAERMLYALAVAMDSRATAENARDPREAAGGGEG